VQGKREEERTWLEELLREEFKELVAGKLKAAGSKNQHYETYYLLSQLIPITNTHGIYVYYHRIDYLGG